MNPALVAAVALSFVFLVGSTLLVWSISRSAQQADALVLETLQVKEKIAEILTLMTAAESAQRGYALTQHADLLKPYTDAQSKLPTLIQALRAQLAGNPSQLTRVDELNATIAASFDAMDEAMRSMQVGKMAEATRVMRDDAETLHALDQAVSQLDRAESEKLLLQQGTASASRDRFLEAVTAMLISCGVLALFGLMSVRRTVATIEASRLFLHEQNKILDARVQHRTQALQDAVDEATRERRRAESLLTDVSHRVGNNLALVSSFLTMQQRAVHHPEAARALDAARTR